MIYNRIAPDNYTIRPEDRFHLLRTDTRYTESQITDIINDTGIITVIPSGAQPEYTGSFTMPSTGQYLYLVWNYTDTQPPIPILDQYSGSVAAYSVRKLSSTYSGPALRVRRNVPPYDEQDIGFDSGGDLDTASMATFASGDLLTVSAWYDQSGNGNNATQVIPYQPRIYNGTAVETLNGKPALNFAANGGGFTTSLSSIPQPYTASYVHASTNIFARHAGGGNQIYRVQTTDFKWLTANVAPTLTTTTNQQTYFFGLGNGASGFGKVSNISGQPAAGADTSTAAFNASVLFSRNATSQSRSIAQEFIMWGVDHGSAQPVIESEANDYYSIY